MSATAPRRRPHVATIGAASSANKGAAAMLQALLDELATRVGPCRVSVLTTYPDADRREPPSAPPGVDVRIVDASPLRLAAVSLPLALLAGLFRRFGLPWRVWCRTPALRALAEADVVADVAGISFSDGRGLPTLVYNTIMTGVPLLLGRPTVKLAQALGPFEHLPTRLAAGAVLQRLVAACPRGAASEANVASLGLANARPAADLAFLLARPPAASDEVARLAVPDPAAGRPRVVVMPSSVAQRLAEKQGIDYPRAVARLVGEVSERRPCQVVLVPHSTRDGHEVTRMNDRGTCAQVHALLAGHDDVHWRDVSLTPAALREVVAGGDLLITSRFHAMISAIATATPVLAVGWGHKYREVLDEAGLAEGAAEVADLAGDGPARLAARAAAMLDDAPAVRTRLAAALPALRARAAVSVDAVAEVLGVGPPPADRAAATPPATPPATPADGIVRDSLAGVIEAGMCIGCGACTAADPTLTLRLDPERQILLPSHASGPAAAAVCPAVQVDFAGLQARRFPGAEIGDYGVVDTVWLAQSRDEDRNRRASSGGLIKELMLDLLADPEVDGVIALGHVDGLDFRPRIVRTAAEVDTLPGSIYHNLDQSHALDLLRSTPGRFVLVAIPCQLEGIWQHVDTHEPHLAERIHTTIGLLCGWQYGYHAIRAIAAYRGVDPDEIADIAYRGGGPVGKLRITTRDGSVATASRRVDFSYQVAFDRSFNLRRCHLCVNHSNYLADVVVGDAWLPATVFTRTGVSLVICRSPHATALVRGLGDAGRVVLAPATADEIRSSQGDRAVFGDLAYPLAEHLAALGVHHPDMVGPNRGRATPVPAAEVDRFWRQLLAKERWQRQRRYRLLWWRKATLELPALARRYLTWFRGRILRGQDKVVEGRAVQRTDLDGFR